MLASPVVKPSAPVFAAHERSFRPGFPKSLELLVDICSRTEVDGPEQIVETIALEGRCPVTLEQGHIGESGSAYDVTDGSDVFLVFSISSVFVFHLHHDDVSSAGSLQVSQLLAQFVHEDLGTFQEIRVTGTQGNVFLLEQPPGQSAHFPFRADIRTGAQHDIHAVFLGQAAEAGHVILSFEVEFTRTLFMDVPEGIDTDGVHPQRLAHLDAVFPVFSRDTGVVDFCRFDQERFSVEQELLVSDFKGLRFSFRGSAAGQHGNGQCSSTYSTGFQ